MVRILDYLSSLYFWLLVIGGLVLWYLAACFMSRVLFRIGEKPIASAKKGILWGWFVVFAVPLVSFLLWDDLSQAVLILIAIFLISAMLILLLHQTAREVDD